MQEANGSFARLVLHVGKQRLDFQVVCELYATSAFLDKLYDDVGIH